MLGNEGGVDALPFDTTQITSPMNYSAPHWGDACHPLAANQHPPAVAVRGDGWDLRKQETTQTSTFALQAIGEYKRSDAASALKMRDYKDATDLAVCYGLDRASYNQGKNAQFDFSVDLERIGAQTSRGPGAVGEIKEGGGAMTSVVRRLTPLE